MTPTSELLRAFGGVERGLADVVERLDARDRADSELEKRLIKVEHRQVWLAGFGAAVGALASKFLPGWHT